MKRHTQNAICASALLLTLFITPLESAGMRILRGDNNESFTVLEGEFGVSKATLTHLFARETGYATIKGGSKIARLVATDSSRVDINDAAEVTYIEGNDKASIHLNSGVVGYLILGGSSQALIKKMVTTTANYPISRGTLTEGGILFSDGVLIQIWADDVSFEDGRLKGKWVDGDRFSISLIEYRIVNNVVLHERAKSLPRQIAIHKTALSEKQ